MNYLEFLGPNFLVNTPVLLAWLVGIILSVRMLRRGGGKSEKLLLAGCSLMFTAQIAVPFLSGLAVWLVAKHGTANATAAGLVLSLPRSILEYDRCRVPHPGLLVSVEDQGCSSMRT